VQTLADTAPVTVEVHAPPGRYPTPVETAAYFAIAEALDDAAQRRADHVAVTVAQRDGRLLVIVEDDGSDRRSPIVGLADRVGALGGTLTITPTACRLEIPCA
jgi:signal transduction histidine kinase